jgi:chemotaxis protein MotA
MSPFSGHARQPYAPLPATGTAFGLLMLVSSIALSANGFHAFFSLGGLVIVVGGVIAVAFMSFQARDVRKALAAVAAIVRAPQTTDESLHHDMRQFVGWAHLIKSKGVREFESRAVICDIDDPLLRYGISMVVSEYSADEVQTMMKIAADAAYERDCVPVDVLQSMASHAPPLAWSARCSAWWPCWTI